MCGIAGVCPNCLDSASENFASLKIVSALEILKNRGYDSIGIATLNGTGIEIRKKAGKIQQLKEELFLDQMKGRIGIGHTRWATHGSPTDVNAHPHLDCNGEIAVVQNGVIDNFHILKDELVQKGHQFKSATDTEVFAHLVEELMSQGNSYQNAFRLASNKITGPNAIVAISPHFSDGLLAFKNESPLVIGVGHEALFFTSDYYSAYQHVSARSNGDGGQFVPLENGEIATISSNGYSIKKLDGTEIFRKPQFVKLNLEYALTGGFPSITEEEIFQQPETCKRAYFTQQKYLETVVKNLVNTKRILGIAAGTAGYACEDAAWVFPELTNTQFTPIVASQFEYLKEELSPEDDVLLAVSQSGETRDTLRPIEIAKQSGLKTYGITNVPGSELTRQVDHYVLQQSGPEIGVASTKAFTSQVMVLERLALSLGREQGKISQERYDEQMGYLLQTPDLVKQTLVDLRDQVKETAYRFAKNEAFAFLGRGRNYVLAREGRLKLQELTYKYVMGYPAGESKHGFIAVAEPGFAEVIIAPRDETHTGILGNIQEMKARGAHMIVLGEKDDTEIQKMLNPQTDVYFGMPKTHPMNKTVVYAVPLQLFATYMSYRLKELDPSRYAGTPDQPRNLAKSVTVP
jgi:glucosamine--fructose-6-phosphate aminotransferase (isomerizing)